MTVYQDFFHYRDGVYRRSYHGNNELKGFHSVRIIGWGEDRGDRYWLVANSWGRQWGENGYFRIARGSNEADIESFVVTGLSDVTEANQK
ncbi:Cathepsin B-like cysteine proteinase 4 [Papilio machaon]|uniref:Cathepsin B-like cysteine proteinase 4 n=2 Tax=Papilio machaon TaxID=76193 RepID=A0A0N1IKT1_PAPMA|nr:Cathepsin B-like cysteine proteinase 4 [Papilio machaon]